MTRENVPPELGTLLGLIVHDLRNPTATIGANVAYLKEVGTEAEDAGEALEDVETALGDLMRGLDQVAWIGRWLVGEPAVSISDGDVGTALRELVARRSGSPSVELDLEDGKLPARGGGTVGKLVDVLLANATQHGRNQPLRLSARRQDDGVLVEVRDTGAALAPELRDAAFTLEGQSALKGRADGRYGRVAGLLAARALAEAMGATLDADGTDGNAVFRVRLQPPTGH